MEALVEDGITVREKYLFVASFTLFENDHDTVAVEALSEVTVKFVRPLALGKPGWAIGKTLSGPTPIVFCAATWKV